MSEQERVDAVRRGAPPQGASDLQAFREHFERRYGSAHPGLDFWFEHDRVDVITRHRTLSLLTHPNGEDGWRSGWRAVLWGGYYSSIGFEDYIPRQVRNWQVAGLTREQVVEIYAIAFLEAGPRGMETVARALQGYEWVEPEPLQLFPENWDVDPQAFRSGIDVDDPELSPPELELLLEWYRRVEGEVPPYVEFLARNRPDVLKAYRARFETVVQVLPKQLLPAMLLHHNLVRGFSEGIRENALLARGFGITRDQVLEIVVSAGLYGIPATSNAMIAAAGDVLENWS